MPAPRTKVEKLLDLAGQIKESQVERKLNLTHNHSDHREFSKKYGRINVKCDTTLDFCDTSNFFFIYLKIASGMRCMIHLMQISF